MSLEENIKYTFKNKAYMEKAMTHTSYANENLIESNEKLEFLGDSILEFITSEYLYEHYPELNEGEMTKLRAQVVCEESLHNVAVNLEFYNYIKVGKNELSQQGNKKVAILADSVEALIAAIYFDGGIDEARRFIIDNLKEPIAWASTHVGEKDYKTVLQEKLQEHGQVDIEYEIVGETGPDHNKLFDAKVSCNGKVLAYGSGRSKKLAEMKAAEHALGDLK